MGGDDAYDHVVRGKLSLKGVAVKGGVGKKEKKRSKKEKREKKEKKEVRSTTTGDDRDDTVALCTNPRRREM